MISGIVNADYEVMVPLTLRSSTGNKQTINFLLDSGFNAEIALPPSRIRELDLTWITSSYTKLANGAMERIDVYAAFVEWDGRLQSVYVEAANTDPLLGMRLLQGHDVFFEAVIGGKVTITARPNS